HRQGVGGGHRDRPDVLQDVLGGHGGVPDPRVGELHVRLDVGVEVVADHEHVVVLGHRVHRERQGRVGRGGQHVGLAGDHDDVGGVPAAGALGVEHVDAAPGDGAQGVLHVAGLVEAVGVQRDLDAERLGGAQRGVDGARGGAPVLVDLEAAGAGQHLLLQRGPPDRVALAQQQDVDRYGVQCAVGEGEVPPAGGDRGGLAPLGGPGAAADGGGDAGGQPFPELLGVEEVHVGVDAAGGEDAPLAGQHLGPRADHQVGVDAVLHVGVAGLADGGDPAAAHADVGPDHAPVVEHHDIGDDQVEGALGGGGGGLQHGLADGLAPAEDRLVAAGAAVLLDLDPQVGVAEADLVAG